MPWRNRATTVHMVVQAGHFDIITTGTLPNGFIFFLGLAVGKMKIKGRFREQKMQLLVSSS